MCWSGQASAVLAVAGFSTTAYLSSFVPPEAGTQPWPSFRLLDFRFRGNERRIGAMAEQT